MTPRRSARVCLLTVLIAMSYGVDEACADAQLPALPDRPLDSRLAEPTSIVQMQQRLDATTQGSTLACESSYQANKAQAWINFAKYAYHTQAPRSVQQAATDDAETLVKSLESDIESSNETHDLPTARRQRDDLWRAVAVAKSEGRLCGSPKMMAYCEVQLAWVDYEAGSGGWRHVDPYVRIAEDYCAAAIHAAPVTVAVPAQPASPEGAPVEVASDTPRSVALDEPQQDSPASISLSAVILFPHNRARRIDVRSAGRAALRHVAAQLKTLPPNTQVSVVGHADKTGHGRYNAALSMRRAKNVTILLERLGVSAVQIHVSAVGSEQPAVSCEAPRSPADRHRYFTCLQPNRGVVIRLRDS